MSHLSLLLLWGGSTPDLDPAPDPYLGCTFLPEFKVHPGFEYQQPYVNFKIEHFVP